jgi:DNA-binding IclR family transcriptional regulator
LSLTKIENTMQQPREQRAVQSIEVGGRLLLALAAQAAPMALKDLAAQAGLPASRAHPYLVSFSKLGLVEQRRIDGLYALGPAALQLGLTYLHQLEPMQPVNEAAESLAQGTGHAVAVSVWGNLGPTVVRMIEARRPLHIALRPGSVVSLLGSATGRAFAGVLPRDKIAEALSHPVEALLQGPGAAPELEPALQQIQAELQAHGMTRAHGNAQPGINAFSTPVYGQDQQVVAVLTLIGHQDYLPATWDGVAPAALLAAAGQAARRLGNFSA